MANITATNLTHTTAVTFPADPGVAADLANGDQVPNGGYTVLVMNNTAAAPADVTIVTPGTVDGLPVSDRVFTVPASTVQLVKLGPINTYGTSVRVDCEATTVKLAAYVV